MLTRAHRLRSGAVFASTIRRGRRAGTATLVVHWSPGARDQESPDPVQVGLVVGKAVGNAVVRNQVKRRLRHLMRERLRDLPVGSVLVIRALPPAGTATSSALSGDLDRAMSRVLGKGVSR